MNYSKQLNSLLALALILGVVFGCKNVQKLTSPSVVRSTDGKFQITVPAGWLPDALKTEKTDMKAANTLQEMYVMVINEAKTDFTDDITLDRYTSIVQDAMNEKLTDPQSAPPIETTIGGNPARQYEMRGAMSNIKIAYLVTTIETADHYHQVITWTLKSRFEENRATLQKVAESFRTTTP
jgi:hypothetical protein